jgi:hypothetical protein
MTAHGAALLGAMVLSLPGCHRNSEVRTFTVPQGSPKGVSDTDGLCPRGWTFVYAVQEKGGLAVVCKRQGER